MKHSGAHNALEQTMHLVFLLFGVVTIGFVLLISIYLIAAGLPAIREIGLLDFLFGTEWNPQIAMRADQFAGAGAFGAVPLFAGTFLIMLHGLACWLIGRRIPLAQAVFRCPEPDFSAEWRVLFSPDLVFDAAQTEIRFPAEYLDMANVQNERTMKVFLRSAPANFLVKYRNSEGLVARIRRQLRHIPPDTWPDFETLAQQLHSSVSTLRRHLLEEGQSYQSIKDDLRRDLAISQLCHSDKSVLDIALELGFAEASAFHRAFKKWTGTRPGEYRRALAGQ